MRNLRKLLFLPAVICGLALVTSSANATLLVPGSSVTPVVAAATNPLSGTTIRANTGVLPFDSGLLGGVQLIGTYQAWVVQNWAGNPFGAADLTFVYQVSLTGGTIPGGGNPIIERNSMSSYDAFSTDVLDFSTAAGQVVPTSADRSTNGNVMGFNYLPTPNILVGQTSVLMIVNTNATQFTAGTLTIQNGNTATVLAFSPSNATPEPATAILLLAGLPLGALWYRKRKRA